MTDGRAGGATLRLGPPLVYPAKAAATWLRSAAWLARTRGRAAPEKGIRILYYHRVSDERDELAVKPRRFRDQMAFLASAGYRVVSVPEAARLLDAGEASGSTVALSFDDGYRDIAENALPILEQEGFAATVFVATGVTAGVARFEWYDRQPALLAWDDVVGLDGAGAFEFEAHSITHPNLLALGDDAAREEIAGSKRELEERLGRDVTAFCYPAGVFGGRERELVQEAGFGVATSCEPGLNTRATDRLALYRLQIDARDTLLDCRSKVGGAHDRPLPLRALYRRRRHGAPTAAA